MQWQNLRLIDNALAVTDDYGEKGTLIVGEGSTKTHKDTDNFFVTVCP
jgi:hypothetical protein